MGSKSVFGERAEYDPRRKAMLEAIQRRDAQPEPRPPSKKQRDPKGWAREQLLKWREEIREQRAKESSS